MSLIQPIFFRMFHTLPCVKRKSIMIFRTIVRKQSSNHCASNRSTIRRLLPRLFLVYWLLQRQFAALVCRMKTDEYLFFVFGALCLVLTGDNCWRIFWRNRLAWVLWCDKPWRLENFEKNDIFKTRDGDNCEWLRKKCETKVQCIAMSETKCRLSIFERSIFRLSRSINVQFNLDMCTLLLAYR